VKQTYFARVINAPTCFGTPHVPSSGCLRSYLHASKLICRECVQIHHCQFIYSSYNGPSESVLITTEKTPWRWHVWCVETCWWIDIVWRIHLKHLTVNRQSNLHTMRGTYKIKIAYTVFHIPGPYQVDGTYLPWSQAHSIYAFFRLETSLHQAFTYRYQQTTGHVCKHLPPTPSRLHDFTENQIQPPQIVHPFCPTQLIYEFPLVRTLNLPKQELTCDWKLFQGTFISRLYDMLYIEPIQAFIHPAHSQIYFLPVHPILTPWFNKSETTP